MTIKELSLGCARTLNQASRVVFRSRSTLKRKNVKRLLTSFLGEFLIRSLDYKYQRLIHNGLYGGFIVSKWKIVILKVWCKKEKVNKDLENWLRCRFLKFLHVLLKDNACKCARKFSSDSHKRLDKASCLCKKKSAFWAAFHLGQFNHVLNSTPSLIVLRYDGLVRCGDVEQNPGPGPATEVLPGRAPDRGSPAHQRQQQQRSTKQEKSERPSVQALSYNVRGLSDKKKVRHLINFCHKQASKAVDSVFMFQETFVEKLDLLHYIWRGEYHLTPGTGQSLGCLTLLTSPAKITHRCDFGGRGHVIVVTKTDSNIAETIIANIYAPNGLGNDKLDFFEEVVQKVLELKSTYECKSIFLAGDFNLVFDAVEVKNRSYSNQERRLAKAVKEMFDTAEMVDCWTVAPKRYHTWYTNRNGKQMFSTLDRVMFGGNHLKLVSIDVDWSLSLSDHAMVLATFKDESSHRKPFNFIPRLDPRILEDREACQTLNSEFESLMDKAQQDWNPHVALEYCKMAIRTAVFTTTGILKARFRDEEKELNENINDVVDQLSTLDEMSDNARHLMQKLDDLRVIKRGLVEKIGSRIEQRNARKWHNEGELSNKYFFNLLNRRTNDEINKIMIEGEECTDAKKIEAEIRNFYKELYETNANNLELNDEIFRHINPLDSTSVDNVVGDLTINDLAETLKTCEDSSPGPDGIPYSFLKYFWGTIGELILRAWQYSLRVGELPPSHKLSYLRLIPKAGKDSRIINNLRPITLSCTDHKLVTKTYAKKLTAAVSCRISQEQTAYIPGRLINDNIRSMLMTMDLANIDEKIDGLIVSLDAKKAFDSVDHDFIRRTLNAFGLGRFINIFNVLYKDLKSDIILNGGTIKGYRILKGVKQGDALSCIIFIMCMEPLLKNIKNNPTIEGIQSTQLDIDLPKVYGYADDVNAVIKNRPQSIQAIFKEYEDFSKQSGLVLNADKTEILRFKKARSREINVTVNYLDKTYNLSSVKNVKINGILFFQDPKVREEKNVEKVLNAMSKHLTSWSRRHLTLLGKILILKTYAISQAVFLMQSLMLNEKSLIKINQMLFKFLWNKNFGRAKAPDRIKREIMVTPVQQGGFGMTDINLMNKALNLRAMGRMTVSEHPVFKQLWSKIGIHGFFNVSTNLAVDDKIKVGLKLLNNKRLGVLSWPVNVLSSNVHLIQILAETKLISVLTRTGKLSIPAFTLLNRRPNLMLHQLTHRELDTIARHLLHPNLANVIKALNLTRIAARGNTHVESYPTNDSNLVPISTLSSRNLRDTLIAPDSVICVYKSGLILTPGEVLSWTRKIKKLTSTKHKCALMRVAHGDVYTNVRLVRFGLSNEPNCANCEALNEDLHHRLIGCRLATQTWELIERKIDAMGLQTLTEITLEGVLGASELTSKLSLTIRAEVISRILSKAGQPYCPQGLVTASLKTILTVEKLTQEQKESLQLAILN